MADTIPTHTALTLLTASINHVRHTLDALDHLTLQPHRVAGITLVEASMMDDVMARAELIVPQDPYAVDDPAPLLRLIDSLAHVVNSGHAIAREVTYCAHDTIGMQQLDQCWAASRPVQTLTRRAWAAACATAREPRRTDPHALDTIPTLEQASDASRTAHPAARRGETIVLALAIDNHLRHLATASIQLSNLARGPKFRLTRAAVDRADQLP